MKLKSLVISLLLLFTTIGTCFAGTAALNVVFYNDTKEGDVCYSFHRLPLLGVGYTFFGRLALGDVDIVSSQIFDYNTDWVISWYDCSDGVAYVSRDVDMYPYPYRPDKLVITPDRDVFYY